MYTYMQSYIHENFTVKIPKAIFHKLLFRGDQLTAKCGRGAKKAKINSVDPSRWLDGLIPKAEASFQLLGILKLTLLCIHIRCFFVVFFFVFLVH